MNSAVKKIEKKRQIFSVFKSVPNFVILVTIFLINGVSIVHSENPCERQIAPILIPDPDDCHAYIFCLQGRPLNLVCPYGQRFDIQQGCIVGKCPPCNCATEPITTTTEAPKITTTELTTEVSTTSAALTDDALTSTTDTQDISTIQITTDDSTITDTSTTSEITTTTDNPTTTTEIPTTTTNPTTLEITITTGISTTTEISTSQGITTTTDNPTNTTETPTTTTSPPTSEITKTTGISTTTENSTSSEITTTTYNPTNTTETPTTTTNSTTSKSTTTTQISTTSTTTSTTETPNNYPNCSEYPNGAFIQNHQHCRQYWVCRNNFPILLYCQEGLWFDDINYVCNFPMYVSCPSGQD